MHRRLGRPSSEPLPVKVERDGTETPQRCQAHIQHDRLDEPAFLDPRGDELAETVAPEILVDGNGDKNRTGHGFIAVDGVRAGNSREGRYLDACSGVSNNHNHL